MTPNAWFQCFRGCEGRYPLTQIIYECPSCGGLLEVRHDTDALKTRLGKEWRGLFDERFMRTDWPYGSAVWGKKELVCPVIEDDNVVSMWEGGSNLFWAERLGREIGCEDLWIKQCGNSHTGSFKDLGMTVLVSMVNQMLHEGQTVPAVACASTGDTSAALAAYAAAAGIQSVVFLPKDKVSTAQLVQPVSNGALVMSLETDFDGCMRLVREICQKENIYLANSMNSLRVEGQKTVAIELVQQDDWNVPDWVVIPGGNLGNSSALGKGFLEMKELGIIDKLPRIAVAQAANANPLHTSYLNNFDTFEPVQAKTTLASAIQIGDPVSREKSIATLKQFGGVVEQVTEQELSEACAQADRTGLFCCPHTGVAFGGLLKLLERGEVKPLDKVVVISTAHGLKFTDFKVRYHQNELSEFGVEPTRPNLPVELPAEYNVVRDALFRKLDSAA
ncbi:MAG: threonine synthase [Gemmatimonadetes bacterium]|nr:threonine synthase [Gemmatimonadota bacterium]